MISWTDFEKIDIRVGTIIQCSPFPEAKKPAFKLQIDFGEEIGILKSSAQLTVHYSKENLEGKQVMAVVNFPPKQIGPFNSECLILGIYHSSGVVLISPDFKTNNGDKIG